MVADGSTPPTVDPFDLPEWLGTDHVAWRATSSVRGTHHVEGALSPHRPEADPDTSDPDGSAIGCDLLAVDQAYPTPVLDDVGRREAHRVWTYGQVLLLCPGGRLTLAVPGTAFTADLVLESMGRLAMAVGTVPGRFVVTLRL